MGGLNRRAAMVRHGFTVIELLAVIAILVVVTAISLPVFEGRLAGARFDAAVSRVDAGMAWARAESQRRGEALRVEARPVAAGSDETGLFLEPLEKAAEQGRFGRGEGKASGSGESQPFAVLEVGLVLSDRAPALAEGSVAPGSRAASEPVKPGAKAGEQSDPGAPLILATFLPDGSAMASGPIYVTGFERAASLTLNHWTGGARVTILDLSSAAKGDGQDAGSGATGASGPDAAAAKEEKP